MEGPVLKHLDTEPGLLDPVLELEDEGDTATHYARLQTSQYNSVLQEQNSCWLSKRYHSLYAHMGSRWKETHDREAPGRDGVSGTPSMRASYDCGAMTV
jgi:hypothetical protein